MRTAVVEYKIYTYEELSVDAKETALNSFYNSGDYPWSSDNIETLRAFEKIFPINVSDWEYGGGRCPYTSSDFTDEDCIKDLSGIRLRTYIYNNCFSDLFKGKHYYTKGAYGINSKYSYKYRVSKVIFEENSCPLTGYYMDCNILKPIYDFLKKPREYIDFGSLLRDCLESWIRACEEDFTSYFCEETFIDDCGANEREFLENGEMYFD